MDHNIDSGFSDYLLRTLGHRGVVDKKAILGTIIVCVSSNRVRVRVRG